MLRRPATTIQLTQADIDEYDANRARKVWDAQQAQKQQTSSQSSNATDKAKEIQQVPMKSKKDRIMGGSNQRGA